MAQIIWTEPALNNIEDIADHIAIDNIQAAKALIQKIFSKVERLNEFPESGKNPVELQGLNYREIVVPPCRIFYKLEDDNVYIIYVMRQEQELRKFILNH